MMEKALAYFKGDDGFHHLFSLFKKKYQSLGRTGGNVKLNSFSDQELASIARFFGMTNEELKRKGKVSLEQFEQQLQRTKFQGADLKGLLEAYFGEALISNKDAKQQKEQQQMQRIDRLKETYPQLSFWFDHLLRRTADTFWIFRLMEEGEASFDRKVQWLNQAMGQLPTTYERLPMFSQRITRDPHAFDLRTDVGKLWIHVLAVDQQLAVPAETESINDLLLKYWILRDDITNYVTCANILAEDKEGLHAMWQAAMETSSVLNAPLRELMPMERAYPANGKKVAWIVENSGVFSSLLDHVPNASLICTHGQFKLAGLWLLDLLVEEGCTLYYAGDLDPEGLGMAVRLLERYPNQVKLWKMDVAAYHMSQSEVALSEERLAKLNAIKAPSLQPVITEMRGKKKAGYQEALVDQMIADL